MSTGTHVCTRCSDNFVVNSKLVTCRYCQDCYHTQCVQIKDQVQKAVNECANLFWYCDVCVNVIEEKLNIAKKLEQLESRIDENKTSTSEILNKLKDAPAIQETKESWSSIVKKNAFPPIIIKPKNASQDSDTTKKAILQKIHPAELSVEVKKVKSAGKGSIVIECNDKESLNKLQNKAVSVLSENYTVEIQKEIKPKVVIVGIKEKFVSNEQEFIQRISNQTCLSEVNEKDIKVIKKYTPKNKNIYNVILEVSPTAFKCLLNSKRVFIEWDSLPIYEYVNVLRCFKCWKYGHKAVHCRQDNIVCPQCNKNHKSEMCTSIEKECTNCKHAHDVLKIPNIDYKHSVFDKKCICYQRAQERVKSRTQYI